MTHADTTRTPHTRTGPAPRHAYELVIMRAVDPTHDDNAAGYRKRVKVLAELFNSSSQLTTGRAASAYEYAAELITEAADSYTDTGDDAEDISALYRAINHAAIEGLNLAAYEASERAAGYR